MGVSFTSYVTRRVQLMPPTRNGTSVSVKAKLTTSRRCVNDSTTFHDVGSNVFKTMKAQDVSVVISAADNVKQETPVKPAGGKRYVCKLLTG